jgi:two-component system, sensor histidine kinase and response regulator
MMPEMDGFQVCQELKKNERTRDIPVIFLTAANDPEHELTGLQLGAVDYIHKPFSIPLVEARVATHLELIRSRKALKERNAALEELTKLREDIDRMTRHDLKIPLNAIMGFPQILLTDKNLTEEQQQLLKHVIRAGQDMLSMINHSLDLFKMETGRYQYSPARFDMAALLHTVCDDLASLARSSQVTIEIFVNGGSYITQKVMISAEKILCYSLFANLIKNAIEASPVGAVVKIELQQTVHECQINIINQGGVPELIRQCFFDKYVTAGKKDGNGLGTYSAKLMTEVQKGRISMTSDAQQTTLSVFLPG